MSTITDSGSYFRPDDPGEPSTGAPRLSVTDLEAAILAELVAGLTVLEIGTGLGVSTTAMAATARRVFTVDVDEWVQETIWPHLPTNVMPCKDVRSVAFVDAAFIDGDHSTEATARDIADAKRAGAELILVHDARATPVSDAFDDGWRVIPTTHGIGVWRSTT